MPNHLRASYGAVRRIGVADHIFLHFQSYLRRKTNKVPRSSLKNAQICAAGIQPSRATDCGIGQPNRGQRACDSWHSTAMLNLLLSVLLWPFKALAFLYLIFYEWGWEPLSNFIARLVRFRWVAWIEKKIRRAPSWLALVLFLLPTLILFPLKLGALWLIAHGQKLAGIGVIVVAKIVGTAVVAWLFNLTKPALLKLRWFEWVFVRVKSWKDRWMAALLATALYRQTHAMKMALRAAVLRLRGIFFKR